MSTPYVVTAFEAPPMRRVPEEEYFAAEQTALVKHEYLDGIVRAMPGVSLNHALVTGVLSELLAPELRRRGGCRMLDQDVQIWIPAYNTYTYPDRAIACPPIFGNKPTAALTNPKVIFEALSPSTQAYDRGEKFRRYQTLETLEEYVLVSTEKPLVEVYSEAVWTMRSYAGLDATARLESVGLDLPLRELYADLDWGGAA